LQLVGSLAMRRRRIRKFRALELPGGRREAVQFDVPCPWRSYLLRKVMADKGPGEGAEQCGGQGSGKEVEPGARRGAGGNEREDYREGRAGEEERELGDGRHAGGMPYSA
jgi:hypothetical protein